MLKMIDKLLTKMIDKLYYTEKDDLTLAKQRKSNDANEKTIDFFTTIFCGFGVPY